MARIVIFCGHYEAIKRYDMAGVPILYHTYPWEQNQETINKFCADPNGQLAIIATMATRGFHIPCEAFTVFDSSWRWPMNDAHSIQARARVTSMPGFAYP
jgi:hypothetical protein